ncbi:MAG: hypothetical protein AVDCRST_MAG39-2039 [uncultured Sphingomonadaceae bacterium]|uniref:SAM-dependent methyltransferase n=1 Tax=uncultured Sphingomonadaceae bacterium TaxID=169976 RepID=A0A6J4T2J7_9SPHN|nr:MAG: hypothetical protein AVDCRST_MAG39-2039 [uncultured Sphingomonadaceae bacterium]
MEREIYERMASHADRHWWFVARRRILQTLIARLRLPRGARILEVGCGTGHNIAMLRAFGDVEAVEADEAARGFAREASGLPIGNGLLPELNEVSDARYDLVALLDVLEHVDEDRASLRSIARKLKPGGRLLLTVPAHPFLWSPHDEAHHHKRRYTKKALAGALRASGLRIDGLSYFNSFLFPLVLAARFAGKLLGKKEGDDAMPGRAANGLFERVFGLERHLVGRVPMPPGVSLVAVASRI